MKTPKDNRLTRGIHKYKFTFVMPVYNAEPYLDETVESILGQSVDFEKNVQIVFVNDGSKDGSESICLKYKKRYPRNIVYVIQDNGGVSSARNAGIKKAEGKYISFLDSDDIISPDTLENVYSLFEHSGDIDVVSIKLVFFEAQKGNHMLNFKYASTKVVDIHEEYSFIQLSGGSSFVRTSAIKGKREFDARLSVGEDAVFLMKLILDKGKYGVVKEPIYYYRKRRSKKSAMGSTQTNKLWYTNTINYVHKHLIEYCTKQFGYVPKYVQYFIAYDLQWRLTQESQTVLSKKEENEYKRSLVEILQCVDDGIILEQKQANSYQKMFILRKKYGGKISKTLLSQIYQEHIRPAWIEFIDLKKNRLTIEGHMNMPIGPDYNLYINVQGESKKVKSTVRTVRTKQFLGEEIYDGGGYEVSFKLPEADKLKVTASLVCGGERFDVPIRTGRFTRLPDKLHGYTVLKDRLLIRRANHIEIRQYSKRLNAYREILWLFRIISSLRLNQSYRLARQYKTGVTQHGERVAISDWLKAFLVPALATSRNMSAIVYRLSYRLSKNVYRKKIWILSDRVSAAGDNAEALFRYLSSQDIPGVKVFFAIDRSSIDFMKMKKIGPVVNWRSFRYKVLFMLSDKVVSSHADDFVINPFRDNLINMLDLYRFDYVFLQHGITKDDISGWLNRFNKNIALFISAARPEHRSLLGSNYGYSKDQIALTGFPRYDLLDSRSKNKIIIAPTWRKNISEEADQKTGQRAYDLHFKESYYYKFYQTLINNKSVLSELKSSGMTIEFYLHPSHIKQIDDFIGNDLVKIMSPPYNYSKAFAEGSILLTDYSSVAFDFAYLKKPVIYVQFDRESFFEGHLYTEGYFDYERDGFGPVTYSLDDTVAKLVALIRSEASADPRYVKRIEKFFYKFDKKNSERVFRKIVSIGEKR